MNLRTHKTFRKLENRLFPFGKDDANGKWLIVSVVALILLLITSSRTYGQVVTSNPGEYTILATGNNLINGTVKSETQAQRNTALAQNVMAGEFTKMKQWEKDYNSYLKTATNYASALKAATHIYDDGVRILPDTWKTKKSCQQQPTRYSRYCKHEQSLYGNNYRNAVGVHIVKGCHCQRRINQYAHWS